MRTLISRAQARVGQRVGEVQTVHAWLLAIAARFAPPPPSTPARAGAEVRAAVEAGLDALEAELAQGRIAPWLHPAVQHLLTVLRRLGDGLYHCYDVSGLPRTNNDLEQFYRRVKSGERRRTGRKRADAFVMRVGGFAVYATAASGDTEAALGEQFGQVPARGWQAQRRRLWETQARQTKMRRFHLHREAYVVDLESRWNRLTE